MADTTRLERSVEAFNQHDGAYFDLYTDGVAVHGLPGAQGTLDKARHDGFLPRLLVGFPRRYGRAGRHVQLQMTGSRCASGSRALIAAN